MTTMTGWTMFRLLTANQEESSVDYAKWTGWEIWNEYVRIKMNIADPQGIQYKRDFKNVLLALENQGYIKRLAPTAGRNTPARARWAPTQAGQDWWLDEGVEEHMEGGGSSAPKTSDEYLGRWIHVTKKTVPHPVWVDLMRRYKRGEVAIKFVPIKK